MGDVTTLHLGIRRTFDFALRVGLGAVLSHNAAVISPFSQSSNGSTVTVCPLTFRVVVAFDLPESLFVSLIPTAMIFALSAFTDAFGFSGVFFPLLHTATFALTEIQEYSGANHRLTSQSQIDDMKANDRQNESIWLSHVASACSA